MLQVDLRRDLLDQRDRGTERRGDGLDPVALEVNRHQRRLVAPGAVGGKLADARAPASDNRPAVIGKRHQFAFAVVLVAGFDFLEAIQLASVDLGKREGDRLIAEQKHQGFGHVAILPQQFTSRSLKYTC